MEAEIIIEFDSESYFEWQRNNRDEDFYELCKKEDLAFERIPVVYYKG